MTGESDAIINLAKLDKKTAQGIVDAYEEKSERRWTAREELAQMARDADLRDRSIARLNAAIREGRGIDTEGTW